MSTERTGEMNTSRNEPGVIRECGTCGNRCSDSCVDYSAWTPESDSQLPKHVRPSPPLGSGPAYNLGFECVHPKVYRASIGDHVAEAPTLQEAVDLLSAIMHPGPILVSDPSVEVRHLGQVRVLKGPKDAMPEWIANEWAKGSMKLMRALTKTGHAYNPYNDECLFCGKDISNDHDPSCEWQLAKDFLKKWDEENPA